MKIIKVVGAFIITMIFIFNLSIKTEIPIANSLNLKSLNKLQALADELPPVEIICNYPEPGRCWEEDCHWEWTPLGGWFVTYCPSFTGYTTDICVPGLPC